MKDEDEFMRIALGDDENPLKEDFRKLLVLWIASMKPEHRARMDKRILDQFAADMPRDTALLQLRDFVNNHTIDVKMGLQIYADSPAIDYHIEANKEASLWMGAIKAIDEDWSYRLCDYCGKPFSFKSTKAQYCSHTCRNSASRENRQK